MYIDNSGGNASQNYDEGFSFADDDLAQLLDATESSYNLESSAERQSNQQPSNVAQWDNPTPSFSVTVNWELFDALHDLFAHLRLV